MPFATDYPNVGLRIMLNPLGLLPLKELNPPIGLRPPLPPGNPPAGIITPVRAGLPPKPPGPPIGPIGRPPGGMKVGHPPNTKCGWRASHATIAHISPSSTNWIVFVCICIVKGPATPRGDRQRGGGTYVPHLPDPWGYRD